MNIFSLSVPFLELLASKVPQLEHLWLGVSEINQVGFLFALLWIDNTTHTHTLVIILWCALSRLEIERPRDLARDPDDG